jgi:excisionase family DNA binding protein
MARQNHRMEKDYFNGLKLVGSKDVQRILNVSRSFIQRIINDKSIPAQRTSAGWIFPEEAVLEFQKRRLEKSKTDKRFHV